MQVNTAVIFAGGKSRRMGEDKSLLPFGKYDTLAQFQYEKLKKIFKNVYLSTKNNKFDFTDNLIIEKDKDFAPTFGILEAINKLNKPFFALGVDIPFIEENTIKKLLNIENYDVVSLEINKKLEPMCSVYFPTIKPFIEESIKKDCHRLTKILKNANSFFVEIESGEEFLNLNDKETYKKALAIL